MQCVHGYYPGEECQGCEILGSGVEPVDGAEEATYRRWREVAR